MVVVGPDVLILNIFNGMFMRRELVLMEPDQISQWFSSNLHSLVHEKGSWTTVW